MFLAGDGENGLAEAQALRAQGREHRALRMLRRLSRAEHPDAAAILEYGHALRAIDDPRRAAGVYRRAAELFAAIGDDAGRADALFGLAAARLMARDLHDARPAAEAARRLYASLDLTARAAAADRMSRAICSMAAAG